jgi:hypothetical protein
MQYIRTSDVWLDLRIALCTLLRLVGLRGGRAVSLLGLKRCVVLPPSNEPQEVTPVVAETAPVVTTIEVPVVLEEASADVPATDLVAGPTTIMVASQG